MARFATVRPEPGPPSWELPLLTTVVWALTAVLLLPAGQSLAEAATGHGLGWPTGTQLWPRIGAILTGHPDAGGAHPVLVYVAIAGLQVAYLAASIWALRWWWRTAGPGRRAGLAAAREVDQVLGHGRLRRHRSVIRPDLFPRRQGRSGWGRR